MIDLSTSHELGGRVEGYVSDNPANLVRVLRGRIPRSEYELCIMDIPSRYAVMHNFYINEECRGQGIGNYLLDEVIRKARISGAECMYSQVNTVGKNKFNLRDWYFKHGFYQIDKEIVNCPMIRLDL